MIKMKKDIVTGFGKNMEQTKSWDSIGWNLDWKDYFRKLLAVASKPKTKQNNNKNPKNSGFMINQFYFRLYNQYKCQTLKGLLSLVNNGIYGFRSQDSSYNWVAVSETQRKLLQFGNILLLDLVFAYVVASFHENSSCQQWCLCIFYLWYNSSKFPLNIILADYFKAFD